MTRLRLRPAHSLDELARLYSTPHNHTHFADHITRVAATIEAGLALAVGGVDRAADLSCGSGAILDALPAATKYYGDFAPGYDYNGPLEETLHQIPDVDLYVCCETLEHLDDPAAVLKLIRGKTDRLLLSTPVDAWNDHNNPEHYWAWSRDGVEDLLTVAGFNVVSYAAADLRASGYQYCFGIWGCS